jgi:hypothetical protein
LTAYDDKESDYFGIAYYHPKQHFLVLANRGTEPGMADIQADFDLVHTRITAQQVSAYLFTNQLVELAKEKGYSFSTTGHSLGGWLSQLCILYCHKDFDYKKTHAVVFDSPGIGPMFKELQSNLLLKQYHPTDFDIKNYVSYVNVVNTCHEQVGEMIAVKPKLPKDLADWRIELLRKGAEFLLSDTGLYTVVGHSLSPIVDVFDQKTGLPKESYTVEDWPLMEWSKSETITQEKTKSVVDSLDGQISNFLNMFGWQGVVVNMATYLPRKQIKDSLKSWVVYKFGVDFLNVLYSYARGDFEKSSYKEFFKFAMHENGYFPDTGKLTLTENLYPSYTLG